MNGKVRARQGALLAIALLLPACAGLAVPTDPAVLLVEREDVPRLTEGQGVSSAEVVARWHGLAFDAPARALAAPARPGAGVSAEALRSALEHAGLEAIVFRGTDDGSATGWRHHLDRGRPLIVRASPGDRAHWVVLVGYDDVTPVWILLQAGAGLFAVAQDEGIRMWEEGDRICLLTLPGAAGSTGGSNP